MSKVILNQLGSLSNETTALSVINGNATVIQTAFDNTLSRDGTQPNTMNSNLDMNGFQLLNVGATSVIVASLPTGSLGRLATVSDGTAGLAWGATVTGGGSTKYLVWYNGSVWTVIGK